MSEQFGINNPLGDQTPAPVTYQVGGSLPVGHPTYVERGADRELYQRLLDREYCFVFNSRQMGKSSLRVRTMERLQDAGVVCAVIDPQSRGTTLTEDQWYAGTIRRLIQDLGLGQAIEFRSWWKDLEAQSISAVERFSEFVREVLLGSFEQPLVIFVEEIDNLLSLNFDTDGFFSLIRSFYEQRSVDPRYQRLTFSFLGVATPADLILGKQRSSFNIGRTIEMAGFSWEEAQPLLVGLESLPQREAVLGEVLWWTGGQPFLTQKVLNLVVQAEDPDVAPAELVERQIRAHIIENWESQDVPPHLKTIRDRILRSDEKLRGRLLGMYQQILDAGHLAADESREQLLLRLTGLVVQRGNRLEVYNPIYREIFGADWVQRMLAELRPGVYGEAFQAWQKAEDEQKGAFLLRGQALRDAEAWAREKRLSDADAAFLSQGQAAEKREMAARLVEGERKLEAEAEANRILSAAREQAEAEKQEAERQKEEAKAQLKQANRRNLRSVVGAIAAVAVAAIAVPASIVAAGQVRQAKQTLIKTNIETSVVKSNLLFESGRKFEALIQAIKALESLKTEKSIVDSNTHYLSMRIRAAIREGIYEVRQYNSLEHSSSSLYSVSFSSDGENIASASADGTVKLWNRKGQELQTLTGHSNNVNSVSFSPDEDIIASASADRTVKLWNRDGQELKTLDGHSNVVRSVNFSPDGGILASASADGTVKLWNRDGEELKTLAGHSDGVNSVSFSPDGETIVSASADGTAKLWNQKGQELKTLTGHNHGVNSVSFSPDGETIASASADGTVKLWNLEGQELKTLTGHNHGVSSVSFSPNGKIVASAGWDGTVKLWDREGQELQTLAGHSYGVSSVSFSSNGEIIASASWDGTVKLWNWERRGLKKLTGHSDKLIDVSFSPDGEIVASAGWDGTVKLWNRDGQELKKLAGHSYGVNSVSFSSDGDTIASASADKTVKLWNREGQGLKTLWGHGRSVTSVSFSSDGETIASASYDRTVKLWNRDGQELKTLTGHSDGVYEVSFSPDGETIASASADGTVKLWNREGQELKTLAGHSDAVHDVSFSPDGKTIASASADRTVKLWNREGKELKTLSGHTDWVLSVVFSSEGRTIASSSGDGTVKVWNLEGQELFSLFDNTYPINSVDFGPDGRIIASAGNDNTVKLWNLNLDDLLSRSCQWLRDYLVIHPRELEELTICQTQNLLAQSAHHLLREGDNAAGKNQSEKAINIYNLALQWNPDLDIEPVTRARQQASKAQAQILIQSAGDLARERNIERGVIQLQEALNLDPNADLDPNTSEIEQDAQAVANKLAAPNQVKYGAELAREGKIEEAIATYVEAQKLDPDVKITSFQWKLICWNGSLNGYAETVLFACEKAIELQSDGRFHDDRGLARALMNDTAGAIQDFEIFLKWATQTDDFEAAELESEIATRTLWISALKQGGTPFTPDILEGLKTE